jgi:Plasmid pRiA4b ORF-3-like protein
MYIIPTFTPAALERWMRITDHGKEVVLSNIWCMSCKDVRVIRDAKGELHSSGDIILNGVCSICERKVCRVIETGDDSPRHSSKTQRAVTFLIEHGDFSVTLMHSENHTLEDLAETILKSVKFDRDHCFGFYDKLGSQGETQEEYTLFSDIGEESNPGDPGVQTTALLDVFQPGKKLIFLFDYGDDWRFDVTCKSIDETTSKFRKPKIVNPKGKLPSQYG